MMREWLQPFSMLLAIAWGGVIFFLSSQPAIATPSLFPHQDKLLHATAFGLLGFLVLGSLRSGSDGYSRGQLLLAIAIAGTYGVLDEVHQHYVPGRTPDGLDVLADLIGATLGVYLLHALVRRNHRG